MASFLVVTRSGARVPFDLGMLEESLQRAASDAGERDLFLVRSFAERAAETTLELFSSHEEVESTDIQACIMNSLRAQGREDIAKTYEHLHAASSKPLSLEKPLPVEEPAREMLKTPVSISTVGETHAPRRRRLSEERKALTHKFCVGGQEGYITVGLYDDGQPGEIFLKMSKEGTMLSGLIDCFATSISLGLQYGVPLRVLARKFTNIQFAPFGATENPNIPTAESLVDYVFRWMSLKFLSPEERQTILDEVETLRAPPSLEESIARLSL